MPNKRDLEGAPTGGGGTSGGRGGYFGTPSQPSVKGGVTVVAGTIAGLAGATAKLASMVTPEDQKHVKKLYKWKVTNSNPSPFPSRSAKPKSKGKK